MQCDNCSKWRVVHAKRKLKADDKVRIESEFEPLSYKCGNQIMDITYDEEEGNVMSLVELRKNLGCNSPIEITYYNSGNENICFHCGTLEELQLKDDHFPICEVCIAAKKKQIRCQARSTYKPKDK